MRRHQPPSALPPNDSLSLLRAYDHESNPSRPIRSSPLTASTIHGLPLELTDRLRSFPLFASAPDSFLVAIGKFLRPQLFQPHEYILTEGDDAKAMYWLVRGSLRVTSRDGESTYAELKPGAFFGEIGILMDIPRTATIIAQLRSLVLKLNKEDLQKVLPAFPAVERAIRDEATERLSILERLKKERVTLPATSGLRKRSRDFIERDVDMQDVGFQDDSNKRRKSPSPSLAEAAANSVLGSANLTVRQILQELPLFAGLPAEILHFLGVNAQPCSFGPFTDIITQGSQGRDVFFLVRGEVEVVTETPGNKTHEVTGKPLPVQRVRARLKPGQYFGEVTSLSLAPKRTATVRSINSVECLRITGQVLDELWKNWSSSLRQQVEQEAKRRLKEVEDTDIVLPDAPSAIDALSALPPEDQWKKSVPTVTFSNTEPGSTIARDMSPVAAEPLDPDPFFSIDIDN
ncbi:RNI-like protein, partial [Aureobasidium melanogenum]